MDHQPRVQVVLGEAERTDGLLRFVLEGEGFHIIGLAADDRELTRVLRGARPAVVVLDGGISAAAALEARRSSPGASFVVVWPDGVSAAVAEEHVEPDLVISDLGDAVRESGVAGPSSASRLTRCRSCSDAPRPTDRPQRRFGRRRFGTRPRGRRAPAGVGAGSWSRPPHGCSSSRPSARSRPRCRRRSTIARSGRRDSPSRAVDPRPSEEAEAPERTSDTREPACRACAPDPRKSDHANQGSGAGRRGDPVS